MKGVRMFRVKFVPFAYCDDEECSFEARGPRARSLAQQHAKANAKVGGHDTYVDIIDRTHYSAERAS